MKISSTIAIGTIAVLFLLFSSQAADAARLTGGLWGQYSKRYYVPSQYDVFEALEIENIDYANFDGHLQTVIGDNNKAYVYWKGYILADTAGNYNIRVDMNSESYNMTIGNTNIFGSPPNYWDVTGDRDRTLWLNQGWHRMYFKVKVGWSTDSHVQVFWTPPGGSDEIVPADHLSYRHWSNSLITIPEVGTEKVNYVTAAVGVHDLLKGEIEIDLTAELAAAGATFNDVLADEVLIVWFKKRESDPDTIIVTNEHPGGASNVVVGGTALSMIFNGASEYKYSQAYARLPSILVDDAGTGRLWLSMENDSACADPEFKNGIALIVPFEDATLLQAGKLSIRTLASSAYHGMSPVMSFPVVGGSTVDPFFIFENGETKDTSVTEVPPVYRPNYLHMLTGNGDPPSVDTILKDQPGAVMIIPEDPSLNLDLNNPETFYPNYGREGMQVDVMSSRYRPNLWGITQAQYKNQVEGLMSPIPIPAGDTWIAYQYIASNFSEDGVIGSGESGSMYGGGIFSILSLEHDLNVSILGNGQVTSNVVGIDLTGINCPGDCNETYIAETVVELTATPNGSSNFTAWGGECLGVALDSDCILVMDGDQTATATFTNPIIDGICGEVCHETHCNEPTSGFCAPPSTLEDPPGVQEDATGWNWVCEGVSGGTDTNCRTERECGWVEK